MRPTHIPQPEVAPQGGTDLYFLAVPGVTYKQLSDAAAVRNLTLAQLVSAAFSEYLKKTEGV